MPTPPRLPKSSASNLGRSPATATIPSPHRDATSRHASRRPHCVRYPASVLPGERPNLGVVMHDGVDDNGMSAETLFLEATWNEDGREKAGRYVARVTPAAEDIPVFPEQALPRPPPRVRHPASATPRPPPRVRHPASATPRPPPRVRHPASATPRPPPGVRTASATSGPLPRVCYLGSATSGLLPRVCYLGSATPRPPPPVRLPASVTSRPHRDRHRPPPSRTPPLRPGPLSDIS
ncbi:hypothetical protein FB559_5977 [Actinoallomurus bryophytorum]|uniref:Uncharacterized protein n=1 Tax=Actinoallomurus bryophytorum TaxID=1490222 RepID=A0A543CT33_9ACTN|nr:hypothetical protein FB559_5977 [Actinoallomurus bryophytorum]